MSAITPDIAPNPLLCPACHLPLPAAGASCPHCQASRRPFAQRVIPPHLGQVNEPPAPAIRRSLLEILLDPRSIHWLLGTGAVLLVVGLVIWLASLGLFQNPIVIAAAMTAGTVATLGGGWATIRRTRYQLAGRAITLLACLVMPLNLWFYNSHGLITLGGHLWLAGVVCCALYAASAWVLRDALFVYVLTGGVAMTGLLMLADFHRFTEIAAPSTLLVALGLIALHLERAFADEGDGPFTRRVFGAAFFRSALVLLGAGLLMLLGAQVGGLLYRPFLRGWLLDAQPLVTTDAGLRVWALALVAAGIYAGIYAGIVRRAGVYFYAAAACLLWLELLAMDVLHLSLQPGAVIIALSLTGLAANVLQAVLARRFNLTRPTPSLGLCLNLLPVLLGVAIHFRANAAVFHWIWPAEVSVTFAVAMLIAAVCCRVGAHLSADVSRRTSATYLFASAAATLVAASAMLTLVGLHGWAARAPILMLIPIGYLLASHLHRNKPSATALTRIAHTATGLMIFSMLGAVLHVTPRAVEPITGAAMNLVLAAFCGEAALFYALAARLRNHTASVYLATVMACGAVWQFLNYGAAATEMYALALAGVGFAIVLVARIAAGRPNQTTALTLAIARCGNAVTSLAIVAGALIGLSRLAVRLDERAVIAWPQAALAAISLAAALVAGRGWKRWYVLLAIVHAAIACIGFTHLLHLTAWQDAELFSVAIGLLLLVIGHLGWYREQDAADDAVSINLLLGSLLAGVPLAIAAYCGRTATHVSLVDEAALLTVGTFLFVSGFLCRIRSTTLTGAGLLTAQLVMMLAFIGMRAQLAVGVYLTLGGGAVFATGLLLSIYRDRLATLPQRIKERRGVFKVLSWR